MDGKIYRTKAVAKYIVHELRRHTRTVGPAETQLRTQKTKTGMVRKFVHLLTKNRPIPLQCPRCLKLQRSVSKHTGSRVVGPAWGYKECCARKCIDQVVSPWPTACRPWFREEGGQSESQDSCGKVLGLHGLPASPDPRSC